MKHVLLYNGIGTAWADTRNSPSITLMALSAFLRRAGYTCRVIGQDMPDEYLKGELTGCVAVGFSVYTGVGILQALELSERLRALAPSVPLVWGGYHATLAVEQTLRHELVDYVVRGEGEHTFLELLNALAGDRPEGVAGLAGLSFKAGGRMVHNPDRAACALASLPLPDYSLYREVFEESRSLPYISSRGCPFSCRFCCNAAFNRDHGLRYRQLPVSRILEDLRALVAEYRPRHVFFWDDLFLCNPRRTGEFLDGCAQSGLAFEWDAFGRCDSLLRYEDALVRRMKESGLNKIYFGVESGSPRMLDYLNKRLRVGDVVACAEKLAGTGIQADFSFMCGFPGEQAADIDASLALRNELLRILPQATARFFVYTPMPGADLVEDCRKTGYEPPATLDGWGQYEFHSFSPAWLSTGHRRWIRNISYATLMAGLNPPRISSWRDLALWLLSGASRWRLSKNRLRLAPELALVARLHAARLLSARARYRRRRVSR